MRHTLQLVAFSLAVLVATQLLAQTPSGAPAEDDNKAQEWAFSFATLGYLVPHDQSYGSPTFTADHKWLHLETRYNYENQETGSIWAGYNFSAGQKVVFSATPMLGAVF